MPPAVRILDTSTWGVIRRNQPHIVLYEAALTRQIRLRLEMLPKFQALKVARWQSTVERLFSKLVNINLSASSLLPISCFSRGARDQKSCHRVRFTATAASRLPIHRIDETFEEPQLHLDHQYIALMRHLKRHSCI